MNARSVGTIAEQAGQTLWVGFHGERAPAALLGRIERGEVGGVILFRRNVVDLAQVAALVGELHAAAPAGRPLLVSVDQEGGRVQRLRAPATEWPPMLRLGERAARGAAEAEAAVALARRVGRALGAELASVGFDVDFAPVLDVHTNAANPVIGDRAFASEAALVTRLAGAFAEGLAAAGVLACGKHFPGHGDTVLDSHLELPRVDHGRARLEQVELAPFRALATGPGALPMIMTAHVVFAAIDDTAPATMSRRVLTELLRGEIGYEGVVVSDDLEMKAIADRWGVDDAAVRGLRAGCDVFLVCHDETRQRRVHEALCEAAAREKEVASRLAEAAGRVEAMKAQHAQGAAARSKGIDAAFAAENEQHRALAREMAEGAGGTKAEAEAGKDPTEGHSG